MTDKTVLDDVLEDSVESIEEATETASKDWEDRLVSKYVDKEEKDVTDVVENEDDDAEDENLAEKCEEDEGEDKVIVHTKTGKDDEEKVTEEEDQEVDVQEDISAIFSGTEITEQFKDKVKTVFTAALKSRIEEAKSVIETKLKESYDAKIAKLEEDSALQIKDYVFHAVREWKEENKVAIEKSIKADIAESFLHDFKSLMEAHNISLPTEKIDVLEAQIKENEELKESVAELTQKLIESEKEVFSLQKDDAIASLSEGLAISQVEKFKSLVSDVEATDITSFTEKASIIKESYFPDEKTKQEKTNVLDTASRDQKSTNKLNLAAFKNTSVFDD